MDMIRVLFLIWGGDLGSFEEMAQWEVPVAGMKWMESEVQASKVLKILSASIVAFGAILSDGEI